MACVKYGEDQIWHVKNGNIKWDSQHGGNHIQCLNYGDLSFVKCGD